MKYVNKRRKMFNKIRIKRVFIFILICITFVINFNPTVAVITSNLPVSELKDEFPASYKPYINELKKRHPNWVFKAVYTNLDWNLVLQHETYEVNSAISLINRNDYSDKWLYSGSNISHDGPYYTASKSAVSYVLDPRNSLSETSVFQFETLSFSSNVHTVESVEKVLANTPMASKDYNNKYKYLGEWITMDETYAQMIVRLSEKYNISPTHVASRIRQENSGNIVNGSLINGDAGVYNFFNIGATPGADGNSAVTNGLNTAKERGWTSPEKAIEAGIETLVSKYIRYGQDTIYFQKFDVNNPYGNAGWLFASQYMTNIMAPTNESKSAYYGYVNANIIDSSFEFHIPVYNNMPETASPSPDVVESRYEADNTRIYLDDPSDSGVVDEFWVRSSPNSSDNSNVIKIYYEDKEGQENRTALTRIGKGVNTPWDKVRLPDGREGYVYSKWVYEYKYADITGISLNKTSLELKLGEKYNLVKTISPVNAVPDDVKWTSSNEKIVSVDENGNIVAKGIGSSTVTVSTVNSKKSATCTVKVISTEVESISLDKVEYTVIVGNTLILKPTVLPATASNKSYTISIENKNILEEKNGVFTAKAEGTTYVTFKTVENNKSVKVKVTVIQNQKDDIVLDKSIIVDNTTNYISNIELETTVNKLKEKINTNLEVKFLDKDNNELKEDSFVGTGTKVEFLKDGKTIQEYTVLIYGDVNGDGMIKASDYVVIKNSIMADENSSDKLKGISAISADIDKNGEVKASDYVLIKNHIMGKNTISQK